MSKHQDLQKIGVWYIYILYIFHQTVRLFGEIVFDNDFLKNKKRHDDVRDNDDLNNA
jgi:hypothetical protein